MGLEMVEIAMDVEKKFDIQLPDAKISICRTFGDLVNAVAECVAAGHPDVPVTKGDIQEYLRQLLIDNYAVAAEDIEPDAELYGKKLNLG